MGMNIILVDKGDNGEEYSALDLVLLRKHREQCNVDFAQFHDLNAKDTIDDLSKQNEKFGGRQVSTDDTRVPASTEDMVARLYNASKKHPNAKWLLC